jgi:putative membrane protein
MNFFQTDRVAKLLLLAYIVLFIICAIAPYSRDVWWVENIPLMVIVSVLVILYGRGVRFSPVAYLFMSVLIYLHTIGGHYTFERVPFDWFNTFFGFERNMYDRVGHFTVGFYAFAIMEGMLVYKLVRNRAVAFLFAVFAIAFVAMGYELIEWYYAVSSDPSAGAAFLGSQGDIWDAQKDMLMDTLGALFASILYLFIRRKKDLEI